MRKFQVVANHNSELETGAVVCVIQAETKRAAKQQFFNWVGGQHYGKFSFRELEDGREQSV